MAMVRTPGMVHRCASPISLVDITTIMSLEIPRGTSICETARYIAIRILISRMMVVNLQSPLTLKKTKLKSQSRRRSWKQVLAGILSILRTRMNKVTKILTITPTHLITRLTPIWRPMRPQIRFSQTSKSLTAVSAEILNTTTMGPCSTLA